MGENGAAVSTFVSALSSMLVRFEGLIVLVLIKDVNGFYRRHVDYSDWALCYMRQYNYISRLSSHVNFIGVGRHCTISAMPAGINLGMLGKRKSSINIGQGQHCFTIKSWHIHM